MKKKIIHRSPTQVIYEDGTSKRFNKAIKIPVRDEDVEECDWVHHDGYPGLYPKSKEIREERSKSLI